MRRCDERRCDEPAMTTRAPDPLAQALGFWQAALAEAPALHAECVRIARRLLHGGRRLIGLLPASAEIEVEPAGLALGLALAQIRGERVAWIAARLGPGRT